MIDYHSGPYSDYLTRVSSENANETTRAGSSPKSAATRTIERTKAHFFRPRAAPNRQARRESDRAHCDFALASTKYDCYLYAIRTTMTAIILARLP
jgi:hypothetical protein